MKHVKTGKYFPMNTTGRVMETWTLIFSTFLRDSQDLHMTSVLSFPNANKKVYFNPSMNKT